MLRINDIYNFKGIRFRILSDIAKGYIWINIESDSALPEYIERGLLIESIEQGDCFLDADPFKELALIVGDASSKNAIKRDENFQLIQPIITHPEFHNLSVRGDLVSSVLENQKTTKQTIYRLLRKYWQRGQIPNALLPAYTNRRKDGKERQVGEKKLGRPRVYSGNKGVTLDEGIKRLFNQVISKYLFTKEKTTIAYAYRKFQSIYHSLYPEIADENIPTIWQFKYFYDKEYSQSEKIFQRTDKKIYNKDIRQLKSTVNTHILGTGSKYEIDATIADIYLLSDADRQSIVGRPIVYLVVDVFSRMVAGFYIGFENPSYVTAMQAFKVAVTDKVELCNKFDIEIATEDWPCIGLPEAILADRGELLGHQVEVIEKNFSIRIENTPAFRGDAKGIVERYFRTIQATFKPFISKHGLVQGVKEVRRGGNDYRLDATLTISDFTKIILNSILIHNNTQQLVKYDREADMPANMPLIPIEIWHWGIQNRTGKLRSVDEDVLSVALLPRQKATLSDLGLKVFNVYYHCKEITEKGWLHRKSSVTRPKAFQVGYDLNDASKVYIFYEENSLKYWEATLADRSREFENCTWWEVWQIVGVGYCLKHQAKLLDSTLDFRSPHRHEFFPISEMFVPTTAAQNNVVVNSDDVFLTEKIFELLQVKAIKSPNYEQWTAFYNNLALINDCIKGQTQIIFDKIREKFLSRWDVKLLNQFNLDKLETDNNWLISIFRKHRKSFSYLEHVLVIEAFEAKTWNFETIFKTVKNVKIQKVGTQRETPPNILAEIPLRRQQWLNHLSENNYQIKQTRKTNGALYAWLYRNDKEWLVAEHQKYQNKHINTECKYDWHQRDKVFLKELIQIKNTLVDDIDGIRRSKNFWLKQSKKPALIEKNLSKLPLVTAFLNSYSEDITDYQIRRLARTYLDRMIKQESLSEWIILRKSGLSEQRITEEARHFLVISQEFLLKDLKGV